jgi:hypothetical protein
MAEKNRVRNLSTRWLLPFKVVVFAIYVALCVGIVFGYLHNGGNLIDWSLGLLNAGFFVYFFFRLMKMTSKLYHIEFDNNFLYVLLKNQDMVIPLENIESVEISTVGGVYKINLYNPEQLGDHFYFKMSLFYPLNYQSKDELVNILRRNIDLAKARKSEFARNSLHS